MRTNTASKLKYRQNNAVRAWVAAVVLWCLPFVCRAASFSNWDHSVTIVSTGYKRAETLSNFPVLVVFTTNRDEFAYEDCNSSIGADLRFSSLGGTSELPYEIERWDTNGKSYVWVQVPELAQYSAIVAYWGNPDATNPPPYTTNGSVWSGTFRGVWHLNESSGTRSDSTENGYHATPNAAGYEATGIVAGAVVGTILCRN